MFRKCLRSVQEVPVYDTGIGVFDTSTTSWYKCLCYIACDCGSFS